jgi:hypothetical protein
MTTLVTASANPPPEVTEAKEEPKPMLDNSVSAALTPEEEEEPTEEKEEGADEEDELFTNLEKEEETRLLFSPSLPSQPKDVQAAPKLLQKALEDGQVQASDSEQESDGEKNASVKGDADEKKDGASEGPHIHQRVRNVLMDLFCWRDVMRRDAWEFDQLCVAECTTGADAFRKLICVLLSSLTHPIFLLSFRRISLIFFFPKRMNIQTSLRAISTICSRPWQKKHENSSQQTERRTNAKAVTMVKGLQRKRS